MLQFLKSRMFRILAIMALLIGLYAIAGFVVAPKLVRSALLKDIPQSISATPTVGEIHINPFLFRITVNDFALTGDDGEKLLGFQRLFVDFELSSIWHRAYSFGNIDIDAPYVSAVMAQNGKLNLLQLRPKPTPPKPDAKKGSLPAVRIGSFKVAQGLVTYEDRSRPDVFAARLEPINVELREFTTGVDGGKFTFTGASKLGERVEWHGHVSVDPIESDGEFQVNGLLAHTLWEYLQDRVNFVVDSGTIDVAATYKFSLGDSGADNLQVDVSKVGLTDLTMRSKDSDTDWVTLPSLNVTGTSVDLAKRQAHVDGISLTGLKLMAWLEPDGSVNLMKWAQDPAAASSLKAGGATNASVTAAAAAAPTREAAGAGPTNAPSTPAAAPAVAGAVAPAAVAVAHPPAPTLTATGSGAAAAAGPPWVFDLRHFEIKDASISAEDRSTHSAVKVLLAPLSLQVDGASQDLTKPVHLTLDTHINEGGSLSVSGDLTPRPMTANLDLKFGDIGLTMIQPYIAQRTAMTLLGGKLGGDGKLHYGPQASLPALQFAGNINIDKLHTVDDALQDDFINWDRLDILGLDYSRGPDRLDIEQVIARKLYTRVIIESDSSINVKRVLKIPATTAGTVAAAGRVAPASAAPAEAASAAADARADVPSVEGERAASAAAASVAAESRALDAAPLVARSQSAGTPATARRGVGRARGRKAAANDRGKVAAATASQPMPISIKKIVVQASHANFADLSVKPNFATGIQKLDGTVVGLSSKPGSRAKVDLKGSIDTFSPVSITGEINVLGPLYTDLTMSFSNISLPVFDPYSGKFAGYNIAKGKLTTELHYLVDGRKLDATHHIVVEQLEFGDKTASKQAVSLPIKLAVSLLKDRNGVIDLNIPVTGSLDDPQFRLAPIIWKVFVNILEKAVTAPFALLGSLFGGGPDLQFIDFQPGVATLDPAAADKAKTVAKALVERPQLKIDVPIAVVADMDRPALAAARFNSQLTAEQTAKGSPKKAAAASGTATAAAGPPGFSQLDPTTQLELLTKLYAKDVGGEAKFPDAVTGLKSKPDILSAKIDFLTKAIHEHIVVGDDALQTLGQQRAMALQQALLQDSQVAPERVFLVANDKATEKDGAVRLELSLK